MSDKKKELENKEEDKAFEIIELATQDIELLTKAFHVINKICQELDTQEIEEEASQQTLLH